MGDAGVASRECRQRLAVEREAVLCRISNPEMSGKGTVDLASPLPATGTGMGWRWHCWQIEVVAKQHNAARK